LPAFNNLMKAEGIILPSFHNNYLSW
jgi:hypothetical protein